VSLRGKGITTTPPGDITPPGIRVPHKFLGKQKADPTVVLKKTQKISRARVQSTSFARYHILGPYMRLRSYP